ncbi:MAG: ESPR-type extended signal peptide-containing protein [Stenotrophomonas maltophilia]
MFPFPRHGAPAVNRIYRLIWNTALGCWTVASEHTKGRGKRASAVRLAGAVAVAVLAAPAYASDADADAEAAWALARSMPLGSAIAFAMDSADTRAQYRQLALVTDTAYRDSTLNGNNLVVLGSRSSLTGTNSVGYGNGIRVAGSYGVAMGNNAYVSADYATAVGSGARAYSNFSTALGAYARADAMSAVALGYDAYASGQSSIALGTTAKATGFDSVAIGWGTNAASRGGIAIGISAGMDSSATNAISLGNASQANGSHASAIGYAANASGGNAVAVGTLAAAAEQSVGIGDRAEASGKRATAIGTYSAASGRLNAIAIGTNSIASGDSSALAMGVQAKATDSYAVGIGHRAEAAGWGTTAIGYDAAAQGGGSVALGMLAKAAASGSIAVGFASEAAKGSAVALGSSAKSAAEKSIAVGDTAQVDATAAGAVALGAGAVASVGNTVSVGSTTLQRKIVNVADGVVGKDSKEVVTGGQLYATEQKVAAVDGLIRQTSASANVRIGAENTGTVIDVRNKGGAGRKLSGVADGALADNSSEAVNGKQLLATDRKASAATTTANLALAKLTSVQTALGKDSVATGNAALALGHEAKATKANATALGYQAQASEQYAYALGYQSKASGGSSIAMGSLAHAGASASLSFGDRSSVNATAAGSVALGQNANVQANATNAVALGAGSAATAAGTVSVGSATLKRKIVNVGDGLIADGSAEVVTGNQLHATNQSLVKVHGLITEASANGTVRLGIGNTGNRLDVRNQANANRVLTGLADGAVTAGSTEAVTGKQLHATNTTLGTTTTLATTAKTIAEAARDNAATALDKANLTGGLVGQVSPTGNVRLGAENTGTSIDVRNKSNAARKLSGVADATLSATSTEAVTGKQLHATNTTLGTTTTLATTAKTIAEGARDNAATALDKANLTGGLVGQVSPTGNVRLGAENTGTSIDVRNKSNAARKLSGVADGALSATSTEAVTGKQLFNTEGKVKLADDKAVAAQSTADGAKGDAAAALQRIASTKAIIGTSATAAGSNANAMGYEAQAGGSHSNAVGFRAKSAGGNAVGLGTMADAAADDAIAMGNRTVVDAGATGGVALGAGAKVEASASNGVALGQGSVAALDNAVSVGNDTTKRKIVNVADGLVADNSNEAITGSQLKTTNDLIAAQAAAVSANAEKIDGNRSSIEGNLAGIGTNRTGIETNRTGIDNNRTGIATNRTSIDTNRANIGVNRDDIAALRSDFEGFVPDLEGAVTFNEDRTIVDLDNARISGLSAGDISHAGSKDAVNGGQLFDTNERVRHIEDQQRYMAVGSDGDSEAARAGFLAVALGDSAEASIGGEGGTAIGSFAKARGKNSVALGRSASVTIDAEDAFALGGRSSVSVANGVALGAATEVRAGAANGVALGYGSVATESNSVSIGSSLLKRRLVNVERGRSESDATTIAQLNGALEGLGGGAMVDASGMVKGPEYVLSRGAHDNVGSALLALDSAIITTTSDIDALDNHVNRLFQEEASTRTDGAGRLALGGAHGMVLGNVADGRIGAGSRDAVNGGQLHATNQKVGENRSEISDLRAALDGMQPRTARSLMTEGGPVFDFGGTRLAGVGAGDISSADSKDAVNGGQLFATNSRIAGIEKRNEFFTLGDNAEGSAAFATEYGIAVGGSAEASANGALAIGSFAIAAATSSVALGRGSYVSEDGVEGFALGTGTRVSADSGLAIGAKSIVDNNAVGGVALGNRSVTTERDTVSVGNDTLKRRIVNVANGTANQDAATVGQLKRIASVFGGTVDANGNPVTPSFNVQGGEHRTVGDALTALDTSVEDNEKSLASLDRNFNRLFQEDPTTRTDGPGRLNLGGAHGMVLGNVANGLIASGSRDAVNGGQLYEVQKNLQGQIDTLEGRGTEPVAMMSRMGAPVAMSADAPVTTSETAPAPSPAPVETPVAKVDTPEPVVKAEGDTAVAMGSEGKERSIRHVAKGTADTDAVNVRQLNEVLDRANEYTDLAVEGLNKRLDGMDKRFNRMAAMSSAQSAMAMNTAGLNTYNRLGAGVGHSDGESALAVGYQRVMNERGSATFSLNGAFTNSGEKTVGVGVGIGW